jgi:hypothetical protein
VICLSLGGGAQQIYAVIDIPLTLGQFSINASSNFHRSIRRCLQKQMTLSYKGCKEGTGYN